MKSRNKRNKSSAKKKKSQAENNREQPVQTGKERKKVQ